MDYTRKVTICKGIFVNVGKHNTILTVNHRLFTGLVERKNKILFIVKLHKYFGNIHWQIIVSFWAATHNVVDGNICQADSLCPWEICPLPRPAADFRVFASLN